jgi:hypothetical protein
VQVECNINHLTDTPCARGFHLGLERDRSRCMIMAACRHSKSDRGRPRLQFVHKPVELSHRLLATLGAVVTVGPQSWLHEAFRREDPRAADGSHTDQHYRSRIQGAANTEKQAVRLVKSITTVVHRERSERDTPRIGESVTTRVYCMLI